MEKQVIDVIAKVLNVDPSSIELDCGIGDMPEWTSMNHLNIIANIEKEFSIKFSQSDIMDLEDISDLVALTKKLAAK
jgi:acyl carrier protein